MSPFPLHSWHFEISSKCTLHCPRCPRQEFPNTLSNTELKLEFFQKNFTPLFVHKHIEKILFCGDDGDPIYAHDLIGVVEYFKKIKPRLNITIITNGSYKKEQWWQQLGTVLNEHDKVVFSVDGWDQESNNKYRVNSNWDSIISGIKSLRNSTDCQLVWATIPFSFNEDKLEYMKEIARSLDMDWFQVNCSSKFDGAYLKDGVDELKPSRPDLVSEQRYIETMIALSHRRPFATPLSVSEKIFGNVSPACINNRGYGLYVNSQGKFFPCCWIGNRHAHNDELISNAFNLYERSLGDILEDKFWGEDFLNFKWFECQTKCKKL